MSCSKRGDAASCNYSNGNQNGHDRRDGGSRTSEAQLRLQKLEQMVTNLMQTTKEGSGNRSERKPSYNATLDQRLEDLSVNSLRQNFEASSGGYLDINGSETNYHGATHWAAILDNIRDIQGVLEPGLDNSEETPPSALTDGPDILLDTTQSLTLTDVCNSLPPRTVVDKLLTAYFNAKHIQLHGLPKPAFLLRSGQTLVTGGYQKAKPYSVEAILLYAICKYMIKADVDTDVWMIMGISARLALKMGYHRDPRHLANISPFEGEMRRRIFSIVETFDLLFAFQAGLPAIIHEEECDTESPSNLFDTDFDENCTALPASRPPTDPTPMLYYCFKSRLAKIYGRVIRHALSLQNPSYEGTLKLDGELREINAAVPPSLRMRPLGSSFTDQTYEILNRLNIEQLYLKSLCILHRKYLSHDRSNPAFIYSRRTCTDAGLQLLKFQAEIHDACQPGGQLYNDRWMLSSLTLHGFLLAAMITSLDLYESHKQSMSTSPEDMNAQVKKYDALKLSHGIWTSRRGISRDARRAANVLAAMLSKVPRPNIPPNPADTPQEMPTWPPVSMNGADVKSAASISSRYSSWDMSGFDFQGQEFPGNDYAPSDAISADPLNTVFNDFDNIDWGLVDQNLLGGSGEGDIPFNWELLESQEAPPDT
ncbi:hypothetical protein OEA41_003918 [Lepraria neglecta]|uniref:Xylanolytic transcriptional activator regulatory domain-containing protein n=1 Tax=Lepraria neglecta TaxID=209136 RepID=A0AAE0DJB9_9LECA|nr:hypothetical protein OEA41_003918 [Lepraria neglecta]